MNCAHDWSSGIYGLAYRCKKCDCLPSLDVAHHVALERVKDIYNQLASARSRIDELEGALEVLDYILTNVYAPDIQRVRAIVRQALSGKAESAEPEEVDTMVLKEIIREAVERYDRYTANVNMTHEGTAQMVVDAIQPSLTNALSLSSAYREALEEILHILSEEFSDYAADIQQGGEVGTGGVNPVYSDIYSIARQALSGTSSPVEPEPETPCTYHGLDLCTCAQPPDEPKDVSVEKLSVALSEYLTVIESDKIAAHILTKYTIKEKV